MSHSDEDLGKPPARSWLERLAQILLREPHDREELITLLRDAEHRRLLDADALDMIEGVLNVSDMQVRDIMIPRSQMITIDMSTPLEACLPTLVQSGHSRFPITGETPDDIIGILFAKDLLKQTLRHEEKAPFSLETFMRPAVFVPESKRLNILLKEFRANRNHMAIVVDEYGGAAGLITIEDVLEEIVGEIADEHDMEEDDDIKKIHSHRYLVKALTTVHDFNDYFESDFSDEAFDTIGGLVTHTLGRLPKSGETIQVSPFDFRVLQADTRRVTLLEVTLTPTPSVEKI